MLPFTDITIVLLLKYWEKTLFFEKENSNNRFQNQATYSVLSNGYNSVE